MGKRADRGTRTDETASVTPERAALATWDRTIEARPHAVSITVHGDRAEVVIETEPASREWVYCVREDAGWRPTVSGNGPTPGWDDPSVIDWS